MRHAIACMLPGLALCACASAAEQVDEVDVSPTTTAQYFVEVATERGTDGRGTSFSRAAVTVADFEHSELPNIAYVDGCVVTDLRSFDGYPPWSATAGNITIVSDQHGTVVMKPLTDEYGLFLVKGLPLYAQRMPDWQPGEKLALLADGEGIPKFWATLRYPEPVELKGMETRAVHGVPVLDSCTKLVLEWEPTDNQQVGVQLVQYRPGFPERVDYRVQCFFPGTHGTGVVPADVLAGLDKDDVNADGSSRTVVYTTGQTSRFIKNGRYEISVALRFSTGKMVDVW